MLDIARSRNYECTITNEQFINYWNSPCIYCNISILKETGIGLDRIDNNKHYTPDNVNPCCGNCNKIRGNYLTYDEMKVAMTAVVEFRNLGEA